MHWQRTRLVQRSPKAFQDHQVLLHLLILSRLPSSQPSHHCLGHHGLKLLSLFLVALTLTLTLRMLLSSLLPRLFSSALLAQFKNMSTRLRVKLWLAYHSPALRTAHCKSLCWTRDRRLICSLSRPRVNSFMSNVFRIFAFWVFQVPLKLQT